MSEKLGQDPTLGARAVTGFVEGAGRATTGLANAAGDVLGGGVRAASRPFVWGARAAGRAVGPAAGRAGKGLLSRLGKGMLGIAGRAPMATALGIPFFVTGLGEIGGGMAHQQGAAATRQMAGSLARPGKVVVAFDRTEVTRLAKISRELEKQAARRAPIPKAWQKAIRTVGSGGNRASPRDWLMAGAALAAGGTALGLGQQALTHAAGVVSEKVHAGTQDKQFQAMLKADPSLKHEPRARQMFSVLHRASAYLAGEPVLAAATVQQMMHRGSWGEGPNAIPNLDADFMRSILNVQKARDETRFPGVSRGAAAVRGPSVPSLPPLDLG